MTLANVSCSVPRQAVHRPRHPVRVQRAEAKELREIAPIPSATASATRNPLGVRAQVLQLVLERLRAPRLFKSLLHTPQLRQLALDNEGDAIERSAELLSAVDDQVLQDADGRPLGLA